MAASFLSYYWKTKIIQRSGKCHWHTLKRHSIPAVSSHSCCSIPQTPGEFWGCRALKCERSVSPCAHKNNQASLFFQLYSKVATESPKAEAAQEIWGMFVDFKLLVVTWPGCSPLLFTVRGNTTSTIMSINLNAKMLKWHRKATTPCDSFSNDIYMCRKESKSRLSSTTLFWCQTDEDISVVPAGLWFGAFICGFLCGHRSQVNQTTAMPTCSLHTPEH